ncbi:MAG: YdcF family protein [Parasporobacterium sp.]|nr:YdcF family protein [Parasporobacterium sp.]
MRNAEHSDRNRKERKTRAGIMVLTLILAILLSGCSGKPASGSGDIMDGDGMLNSYLQITQEEAAYMMTKDDGHVVVDVRRQDEYDAGHIPGAILIPNESIGEEPPAELPDKEQIILVYCRSGRRSKEAAQKLFDMGYERVYEFGGIIDWTGEVVTAPVDEELVAVIPQTDPVAAADPRTPEELIREIILYHGSYDKEADDQVKERLHILKAKDPRQGELWEKIMDYWVYANEEMPINMERLPEDLPQGQEMCIVVLGFELNDDGTMQDELIGRLQTALTCAEQYPEAYIVCTGGGTAANNKEVTEAGLMGDWLKEHGLDESRLIIEDASHTTAENARFSYDILLADYPQVTSVALVSSSYHIAWGSLLFEASFLKAASEQQSPEIHVISNAAYPFENAKYMDTLRFETGGMLQLIGENPLAMDYYMDRYTKPELD